MGYLTMGFHSCDSFPILISPVSHGVRILQKPTLQQECLHGIQTFRMVLQMFFFVCVCVVVLQQQHPLYYPFFIN